MGGGRGELAQISLGDVASLSIMRQSVFRCRLKKEESADNNPAEALM